MLWAGNATPKLVALIGPGLLAYTVDLKSWIKVDVSSVYDGTGMGVDYNSTGAVLMIANYTNNAAYLPQQERVVSLPKFKVKSAYTNVHSTAGLAVDPTAGKLKYDAGRWMFGGANSKVAMSTDNGATWTKYNTWASSTTRNPSIVRYFASKTIYVACYPNVSQIGTSPVGSFNSSNWTVTSTGFTTQTRFVAEGATGNFLALGGSATVGQIATSTTLTTWTSRTWINTNLPNWAVWNGTTWVVVANGGTIATSTDGVTWTSRTSGITSNLLWVDWDVNKNQFIAVGDSMIILTSPDGVTWSNKAAVATNFSATTPIQVTRVS
jgi:hypothetical protein